MFISREFWILLDPSVLWTEKQSLTHPASVQLHFEQFWFRCWRCQDFEPVLTAFHSLLALLVQTIEGQYLQDTQAHFQHPHNICLPSRTLCGEPNSIQTFKVHGGELAGTLPGERDSMSSQVTSVRLAASSQGATTSAEPNMAVDRNVVTINS